MLAGFGITAGEGMPLNEFRGMSKEQWLWKTYGEGIRDGLKDTPDRKFRLIHRFHMTALGEIQKEFAELPCTLDLSFKYAIAHMYSVPNPSMIKPVLPLLSPELRCWLTVRNDDIYSFRWADVDYARAFIKAIPGEDKIAGFYMGCDGYLWGRDFLSKDAGTPRQTVMHKQWLSFALWGRLAYEPDLPAATFERLTAARFPGADVPKLTAAWADASKTFPYITRFFWGDIDVKWFPEACRQKERLLHRARFRRRRHDARSRRAQHHRVAHRPAREAEAGRRDPAGNRRDPGRQRHAGAPSPARTPARHRHSCRQRQGIRRHARRHRSHGAPRALLRGEDSRRLRPRALRQDRRRQATSLRRAAPRSGPEPLEELLRRLHAPIRPARALQPRRRGGHPQANRERRRRCADGARLETRHDRRSQDQTLRHGGGIQELVLALDCSSSNATMKNRISLSGRCILLVLSRLAVPPAHTALSASEPARSPANAPARTEDLLLLDNGTVKVGIDRAKGAAITWLSWTGYPKNMVNSADPGRLIQQSYYAGKRLDRKADGQSKSWSPWTWNPIQGGGVSSWARVNEFKRLEDHTLYAETVPKLWDMPNEEAAALMRQWTGFEPEMPNVVVVRCELICAAPG